MDRYYRLYKPFEILSQFSDEGNKKGLGSFLTLPRDVYPVGRLDSDSEGLLLLTNDRRVNLRLLSPENSHWRSYIVQVEGAIDQEAINRLERPMRLKHKKSAYFTLPAKAEIIEEPALPDRDPPIRFRMHIPTSWIRLQLREGKNRQVRKMTAAVGFPTLRLVRESIEDLGIAGLQPGDVEELEARYFYDALKLNVSQR